MLLNAQSERIVREISRINEEKVIQDTIQKVKRKGQKKSINLETKFKVFCITCLYVLPWGQIWPKTSKNKKKD